MPHSSLPRYFVSHADADVGATADGGSLPLHVIDSFFIGHRHLEEREWVVAVDDAGNLRAMPSEERHQFPAVLQNEFAFNEISRNGPARLIEGREIFLFDLQLVEQPAGAPGWNDPIYLYGTLYAPLPANSGGHPAGIKGQLTVTRGDLLDGAVRSSENAFRYGGLSGIEGRFSRCFHLMLAGDTDEEIKRGGGIILAYPLFPAELLVTDVANEIVISQILYDLLSELKADLELEQIAHPLRSIVLPVVSRPDLERELKSQGYLIEGGTAVKKASAGEGFKGFLASVFGALRNDHLILPPEGDADDFLRLARQTLEHLPQNVFPTGRVTALRNRLKAAGINRQVQSPLIPIPQNLTSPTPPLQKFKDAPRVTTQKNIAPNNDPPAWMQDFIRAHRQSNAAPPKLTSTLKTDSPIISAAENKSEVREDPPSKIDWTQDFEQYSSAGQKNKPEENERGKNQSTSKPDWMKDFE